jgi:hypothetical protein
MGKKTREKRKKQAEVDNRASKPPKSLGQELTRGVASVWKEDLEDTLGAVGKMVNFLIWVVIIIAAPVAIHLIGWVLFTLSEMVGA